MKLTHLIDNNTLLLNARGATKPEILAELAAHAAHGTGLDRMRIFRALLAREAREPGELGFGAAMPHAALKAVHLPFVLLARLQDGVDFHAPDARPVDLIILLLGPDPATAAFAQLLGQAARALRDPVVRQRLRNTADARSIPAVLREGAMAFA